MRKQVAVIGLGRFGTSISKALHSMGHEVLVIDMDEKRIQGIAPDITHAVQADATDEAVLKELGIANLDVVIVAMGQAIQSSVLSTILVKKLGVPYVVSRAENELHGSILARIGADKVIYVEREIGARVAHVLTLSNVMDYISVTARYGIAKLAAGLQFAGRTLSELGVGRGGKWGVAVFLIQRSNEVIVNPASGEIVKLGDTIIVAGDDDKVEEWLAHVRKLPVTGDEKVE